jgi:hypothetical protein
METLFDSCEADFFGDLAEDTHGIWEVFEFVRFHNPNSTDAEAIEIGLQYLRRWIQNNWICVSEAPLFPSTLVNSVDLLQFLQDHGQSVKTYLENSPSLDITDEGLRAWRADCADFNARASKAGKGVESRT